MNIPHLLYKYRHRSGILAHPPSKKSLYSTLISYLVLPDWCRDSSNETIIFLLFEVPNVTVEQQKIIDVAKINLTEEVIKVISNY